MAINRSQRFIYFQNKAKHYNNLKNIKPIVDDNPPCTTIVKSIRHIPYLRQHSIKTQNQHLIQRIFNISKAKRSQLETQGTYSKYNKVERPFRDLNKYKNETQRAITIDNKDLHSRIVQVRPAIGSSREWQKAYSKSISCRKNISKYLETNKSKAFVPQHLREYGMDGCMREYGMDGCMREYGMDGCMREYGMDGCMSGKEISVSISKLFELPKLSKRERYDLNLVESSRQKQQSIDKL